MKQLTNKDCSIVSGSGVRIDTALRFISKGARFGGPAGFAIGVGIEIYFHFR